MTPTVEESKVEAKLKEMADDCDEILAGSTFFGLPVDLSNIVHIKAMLLHEYKALKNMERLQRFQRSLEDGNDKRRDR